MSSFDQSCFKTVHYLLHKSASIDLNLPTAVLKPRPKKSEFKSFLSIKAASNCTLFVPIDLKHENQ